MISVEEAQELIYSHVQPNAANCQMLSDALGLVLAEDVFSPVFNPAFDQSAMDGYAIFVDEQAPSMVYTLVGEVKAGDVVEKPVLAGQAMRIFTGAAMPQGSNTVVIQEHVSENGGQIELENLPKIGANIRKKGSQIKPEQLALGKGSVLSAAAIGFLASLGLTSVMVHRSPVVNLLLTGNEIVPPGEPLLPGKIYESNAYTLAAAMQHARLPLQHIQHAKDEKSELETKLRHSLQSCDILMITGGISVGKYDLVYESLQRLGVQQLFYKVAQKPGKPLFVGRLDTKWVFALPGNPASVLVCFYEYVYPAMRKMLGFEDFSLQQLQLKLLADIPKKEARAVFVRAYADKNGVSPLEGQDSNMMQSFAKANAFIYLPKNQQLAEAGSLVDVHLLPYL